MENIKLNSSWDYRFLVKLCFTLRKRYKQWYIVLPDYLTQPILKQPAAWKYYVNLPFLLKCIVICLSTPYHLIFLQTVFYVIKFHNPVSQHIQHYSFNLIKRNFWTELQIVLTINSSDLKQFFAASRSFLHSMNYSLLLRIAQYSS